MYPIPLSTMQMRFRLAWVTERLPQVLRAPARL